MKMKFLILSILGILFWTPSFSAEMKDFNSGLKDTQPAYDSIAITNANSTNVECRAIYIGTDGDYDIYVNGAWVLHQGMKAGTISPIRATGIRDGDDSAPEAGDANFLY